MREPTIVELAKSVAHFRRYENGVLYYGIDVVTIYPISGEETEVFEFPIPVDDAGGGAFLPEMKGLNLMRWIRKHLELIDEGKKEAAEVEAAVLASCRRD